MKRSKSEFRREASDDPMSGLAAHPSAIDCGRHDGQRVARVVEQGHACSSLVVTAVVISVVDGDVVPIVGGHRAHIFVDYELWHVMGATDVVAIIKVLGSGAILKVAFIIVIMGVAAAYASIMKVQLTEDAIGPIQTGVNLSTVHWRHYGRCESLRNEISRGISVSYACVSHLTHFNRYDFAAWNRHKSSKAINTGDLDNG